uniref:Odorant receptor n=1 Tax=Ctenopseustis obliquana TaxID=65030 RepID=A0A097IYQ2_9NEOP|nr:olfactory receptor 63 [Ctenopseustis obliquana]
METAFFESAYRVTYITGWSSCDHGIGYQLYCNSIKLLMALFVVGEAWYLASNYRSLDVFIEQLNVMVIQFTAVLRFKSMRDHKHIYKTLAATMESPTFDTSTPARVALVEYWRLRSEKYLKLILGLGTCTLAAWYVYPLIDDVEYNLPVAVKIPVDYCTPVLYPVVFLATTIAFNYAAYFIMCNDVIMQAHLMHLLCQYTVLVDCFENILIDSEEDFRGVNRSSLIHNNNFRLKYLERLGRLVDQHKLILNHTMELRKVLSSPMLAQVTASSLQICFAGYQVAMTITDSFTKFLMCFLFLGYNMFQLFVFCRWCDEIKSQSAKIGDALYCSGWERGLTTIPGVRRRLLLVAMRANKPLVLTAGGLYDLSLSSFANLVKTSYSALTVLLRLRHD